MPENESPSAALTETDKASYYQIYVPTFGTNSNVTTTDPKTGKPTTSAEPMSSFLRLGATIDDPATTHGADLLSLIGEPVFLDDERERGDNTSPYGSPPGQLNGHQLSPKQRKEESERLLSKGGWRDHSDGNRVSTTYGDKVEIIRGNYKLMVLGRQDNTDFAAVDDISGGKFQDSDSDIARLQWVNLTWAKDPKGVWRITEESEKDSVHSIVHGEVREEFYGGSITSITGSATPEATLVNTDGLSSLTEVAAATASGKLPRKGLVSNGEEAAVQVQKNPTIVEKTWAESITSYTGSEKWWIPTIEEHTWVKAMNSVTNAAAIADTTTSGVIAETTAAGQITSTTTVGQMLETTVAGQITSTTTVGQMLETTLSTQVTSVTLASLGLANLTVSPINIGLLLGALNEVYIGMNNEAIFGGKIEIMAGESVEFTCGKSSEYTMDDLKVALDAKVVAVKKQWVALDASMTALKTKLGI